MTSSSKPTRNTQRIQFRLSKTELDRITEGAHDAGRTVSDFVRLSAIGESQTAWRGDPFLRRAYLQSATLQSSILRLCESTVSFQTDEGITAETRDAIIQICIAAGATTELLLDSVRKHQCYISALRRGRK